MKSRKINARKIIAVVLAMLMVSAVAVTGAFAASTLKNSFTSGSDNKNEPSSYLTGETDYSKRGWGKITNYTGKKRYYLRVYLSPNKGKTKHVDTYRQWTNSRNFKLTSKWYYCGVGQGGLLERQLNRAYAFYGDGSKKLSAESETNETETLQ